MILGADFYLQNDVTLIAKQLLGKVLVTIIDGELTSGIITETEAYQGVTDMASHAFGGRFTQRTKAMYCNGGVAYVYLCYGIHSLFNVVTNRRGIPHAVLIRSIEPKAGIDIMLNRMGKNRSATDLGVGPGKVTKLLGINFTMSGITLLSGGLGYSANGTIAIYIDSEKNQENDHFRITETLRVGISYAKDDANLKYRYKYKKMPTFL